jgi:hypothetical protein
MNRSTNFRIVSATVLLTASLLLTAGCGGPPRAAVEGTVTLDGAPIDGGQIFFLGADAKSVGAEAEIQGGKYSLDARKGPGLGAQKVRILWLKKTGRQVVGSDPPNKVDETIQVVPKKYNSPTMLTADIKPGKNTGIDFKLESGPEDRPVKRNTD